jgi:uncharacterized membrane protein
MSNLIVVGFEGKHRAAEVLSQLERLQEPAAFELEDALAVYRTANGRLRIDRSMNPTMKEGGAFGGTIGALVGAIIALPFTAGGSLVVAASAIAANATMVGAFGAGVGAEDAKTFEAQHGISLDFVQKVSVLILPGNSAVFAKASAVDPIAIASHFRGYGGTVLSTTLSKEKEAAIQSTLRAP